MKNKSIITVTLTCFLILLSSCVSNTGSSTGLFYQDVPVGAAVMLRSLEIRPERALEDIADELPDLINSCLAESGFVLTDSADPDVYELDMVISSKSWNYKYRPIESVSVSMRFFLRGELAAYRLYTEDTEQGLESFLWTFELIRKNIADFALALADA
ncbi:MAG TPA: hypothetical protein DCO79_10020 [Spirochaeta sp.]|nr:hypothetical protein [Spirochaeta sp.]